MSTSTRWNKHLSFSSVEFALQDFLALTHFVLKLKKHFTQRNLHYGICTYLFITVQLFKSIQLLAKPVVALQTDKYIIESQYILTRQKNISTPAAQMPPPLLCTNL